MLSHDEHKNKKRIQAIRRCETKTKTKTKRIITYPITMCTNQGDKSSAIAHHDMSKLRRKAIVRHEHHEGMSKDHHERKLKIT